MSSKSGASGRAFTAAFLQAATLAAFAGCDPQVLRLLPDRDGSVRPSGTDAGRSSQSSCTRDKQCESPLPRCDVTAGLCVECISDDDCGSSERCDPTTRRCTTPCTEDRDCRYNSGDLTYCDSARGFCVECFSNDDCVGSRRKPFCEPATGECVECLTAADCGTGQASCDPTFYYCSFGR